MQDQSDAQLLRTYVESGQETAFREIVTRHADLVYSAALRQVNSPDLARDLAQGVFTDLARKARPLAEKLADGSSLVGWLYRSTRFAALKHLRDDRRRLTHERQAMEQLIINSETAPDWEQVRPVLDETMADLNDEDREALLLRYFKNCDFQTVGQALGVSDAAAQKRVSRALDKLRELLFRRGITTTAATLSAAISVNAVQTAPVGLAAAVASASLAGMTATGGTAFTFLKIMTMTKLKVGIVSAVVVASVATPLALHHQAQARLREKEASAQQQSEQLARLKAENERLSGLGATGSPARNSLDDLQRLRREAETLRAQTNALAALRDENRALKAAGLKRRISLEGKVQSKQEAMAKMSFGRDWLVAFMMYAEQNNDQFPLDFEAARPHLSGEAKAETNLTTDLFEIVYQGKWSRIKKPATTIVIREREAVQAPDGKWMKAYGFADGHWELHTEPEDNFDAWEAERIVPPPAPANQ